MESTSLFCVPIFHLNNIASTYVDVLKKTSTKNDNNEAKLDSSGRGQDFREKKKKVLGLDFFIGEGKKRKREEEKKEKNEENKVK